MKTDPAGEQDDAASDTDHFSKNAFAQLKEPQELDSQVAALRKEEKAAQPKEPLSPEVEWEKIFVHLQAIGKQLAEKQAAAASNDVQSSNVAEKSAAQEQGKLARVPDSGRWTYVLFSGANLVMVPTILRQGTATLMRGGGG